MKFYVPEIGDELKLTKDWTFTLFPEGRNEDLGKFFGHYLHGYNKWIDQNVHAPMRDRDYKVNYPPYSIGRGYREACKKAEEAVPEYVKYQEDLEAWTKIADKVWKPMIEVTIPQGTILKVDRIYVRKGVGDYSSITFYCKGLGTVETKTWSGKKKNKKALRFWAKLIDCNNIEFEQANED